MSSLRQAVLLVVSAAALASCVAAPPAVLTYARAGCAPAPDLTAAISLTPPKERLVFDVLSELDATAPCLAGPAGPVPYRLYALPQQGSSKTVTAGSVLEQARLVPPEISILDRHGEETRRFARPDYFFRGLVYSVQFRPRADEAYLLVATDPGRIGERYDSIAIGTQTASTYTRGGSISWTTGTDRRVSRTFSYEGAVEVTVNTARAGKAQ